MAPNIINKILGKDKDEVKDSVSSETSSSRGKESSTGTTHSSSVSVPEDGSFNTVDQTINPAVQHEHVSRTHQEDVQEVVDRERHQDHYHTTVQPVKDTEIKPELHQHQQTETQYREFNHGDDSKVQERLAAEQAQFQSTRTEGAVQSTISQAPTTVGEHKHDHIHEVIQPVIEKETVQNTFTHTTVPIKEVHQEAGVVHSTTTAPTISLQEFKSSANAGGGRGGI